MRLTVSNQLVTLGELRQAWLEPVRVDLGDDARRRIAESRELIEDVVAHGDRVYGVNTGFGQLASVRVGDDELAHLQENLVRSHAVGVGEDLDDNIVRLIMLMKVIGLAEGFSGVRLELVERLCDLINNNIYPRIPSRGSVGASGDLAPLAHMASALIGLGEVRVDGHVVPAQVALEDAGIEPIWLAAKEGLALLNGTQVSTALALSAVFRTENVLSAALMAGAMSCDAIKGSDTPFDRRIQNVRGHGGQIAVASVLRELMQGSDIRASHVGCDRVQDPYCIRCQPQVTGACLDVLRHVCGVLETGACDLRLAA
ncbi:MAG: aromatic amino acid lyase, partial [Gammaproteobacteria bacterium]|nr:aromatic amino acid lyase [Gammaproteobacteria bacterium]